jgi:cobalt-zinc-cadmium efflux system protein
VTAGTIHARPDQERRFALALGITLVVFLVELIGGWWTGSLALLSNAAHVFLDVFPLGTSYVAMRVAGLPADNRHTYGWHRLEVLAALLNAVTLFAITAAIFYEAWARLRAPVSILSREMLVIAVLGLMANLATVRFLRDHGDDLNARSAFAHVLGDALSSLGVIAAGIIMVTTRWFIVDPLISACIGVVFVTGSWRVLRASLHVLLEGTPEAVALVDAAAEVGGIVGVRDVHDLLP